jgi:hypothetical protein
VFSYAYFGIPSANLGHDRVLDFEQGEDLIGAFVPFASLDTNGDGALDVDDANVTIIRSSTVIDFSSFRDDPAGTDVLTVVGERDLTASDFFLV